MPPRKSTDSTQKPAPAPKAVSKTSRKHPQDQDSDVEYLPDHVAKRQARATGNNKPTASYSGAQIIISRQSQRLNQKTQNLPKTPNLAKKRDASIAPELDPQLTNRSQASIPYIPMVRIKLGEEEKDKYHFVFDAATLRRSSTWFAEELLAALDDPQSMLKKDNYRRKQPIVALFELKWHDEKEIWVLCRKPTTKLDEVIEATSNTQIIESHDFSFGSSIQTSLVKSENTENLEVIDLIKLDDPTILGKPIRSDEPVNSENPKKFEELLNLNEPMQVNDETKLDNYKTVDKPMKSNEPTKIHNSTKLSELIALDNLMDLDQLVRPEDSTKVEHSVEVDVPKMLDAPLKLNESEKLEESMKLEKSVMVENPRKLEERKLAEPKLNHPVDLEDLNNTAITILEQHITKEANTSTDPVVATLPPTTCRVDLLPKQELARVIPQSACDSHRDFLLLLMHNYYPKIENDTSGTIFSKTFAILQLTIYYDTHLSLQQFLRSSFLDAGKDLYIAIKNDPATWLGYGWELQSSAIFKEAVVHLVGSGYKPGDDIPEDFCRLIAKKSQDLKNLEMEVRLDLYQHVIDIYGSKLELADKDSNKIRSWCVLHLWRDWFIDSFAKLQNPSESGSIYRTIAKGGDAYLTLEQALFLLGNRHPGDSKKWRSVDIAIDLQKMKNYAKQRVRELVVNNTMVDIRETGIQYLTCTTLEDKEARWWK